MESCSLEWGCVGNKNKDPFHFCSLENTLRRIQLWAGELVDGCLVHKAVIGWGDAFSGLPKSRVQTELRE